MNSIPITPGQNGKCLICNCPGSHFENPETATIRVVCPSCKIYKITIQANSHAASFSSLERAKIAEWIYQQNSEGIEPTIKLKDIDHLILRNKLTFLERIKRLLLFIKNNTTTLGVPVEIQMCHLFSRLQTFEPSEITFIITHLADKKFINLQPSQGAHPKILLTQSGIMQAEEWETKTKTYKQGFMAMCFDGQLIKAWENAFQPAIKAAGYDPFRIDMKEHNNKIDDAIIVEIKRSAFLIADFTGHKGGVYYEAGYAHGIGIPVIFTCHESDFDKLHFDIRQYNCIKWTDYEFLKNKLQSRLQAL